MRCALAGVGEGVHPVEEGCEAGNSNGQQPAPPHTAKEEEGMYAGGEELRGREGRKAVKGEEE